LPEASVAPSDAELIERCLRGEANAWEQIVVRFRRRVFHIAYKFTGKHDEAEDLTQEIFLKVFRGLEKFHRDADFGTWLSSVARNYCIDHYRASKREREVLVEDLLAFELAPASSGNPYRQLEDSDRRSLVRRGLDLLPVKSRINRGREELARLLRRARQPGRPARGRQRRRPGAPEVR
jgi:RNA polymerase sigma-70 factor (ECF subfamily)